MKNKKGLIILSSVVGVCALGLVISPLMDWNVDSESVSGNIGKTSRFSRKAEASNISNMEELILNDPSYKNGMVASYMVMETRAQQFEALVNMSNQAAGEIPEFAKVLKEMNEAAPLINNVCATLAQAGSDLNGTLANEQRPDLAQNVINASLAYTALQKQNKLATQFIDTTDKYLKTSEGTDELKFVRDQWVDYQQMTAALDGDEKAAKELESKGYLLSSEQSVAALHSFGPADQLQLAGGVGLSSTLNVNNNLSDMMAVDGLSAVIICSTVTDNFLQAIEGSNIELQSQQATDVFNATVTDVIGAVFTNNIASTVKDNLGSTVKDNIGSTVKDNLGASVKDNLSASIKDNLSATITGIISAQQTGNLGDRPFVMHAQEALSAQQTGNLGDRPFVMHATSMGSIDNLMSAFQEATIQSQVVIMNGEVISSQIVNQLGDGIKTTTLGNQAEYRYFNN